MNAYIVFRMEQLPAPAVLIGADDLIIFANTSAQEILLDIDVTDMPAESFFCDWKRCRLLRTNPETKTVEVFLRNGQYQLMSAALFDTKLHRRPVSGVVLMPASRGTNGSSAS
ncbi:hypothetical protein [Rhizobium sp. Rhizsp42]|uniref:hypothetical protein n=1 Tax=Rhizobium sp. Rhizsp42 TaxID=3243034 RepID=UPI0013AF3DED